MKKQLALKVKEMRSTQNLYFQQIAKAKRSKSPDDFQTAKETLNRSKLMEVEVDQLCNKILEEEEVTNV